MIKKIMILEDDEPVAELIKFYLEEEGYKIFISDKGEGFIDKVVKVQPDMITLDVMLPDTDGFSIFSALLKDPRTKDIPVIFITVKEEELETGLKMGASGYITKPFKEDTLKDTIKSIIEKE